MRRTDRKLDRLAALHSRAPADLVGVGRVVELVEAPAGAVVAVAGVPGTWRTLVLTGAVATTSPPRVHVAGEVIQHGPETAIVAVQACRLATVPEACASLLAGLTAEPPDRTLPAPPARTRAEEPAR